MGISHSFGPSSVNWTLVPLNRSLAYWKRSFLTTNQVFEGFEKLPNVGPMFSSSSHHCLSALIEPPAPASYACHICFIFAIRDKDLMRGGIPMQ